MTGKGSGCGGWKFICNPVIVRSRIKPSAYVDSVTLMFAQREVRNLPGVREAGAVMGTDANKELLQIGRAHV